MKRRDFLKHAATLAGVTLLPSSVWAIAKNGKLRTAHIGVGGMGLDDLKSITSHEMVEVTALCDVDSNNLSAARRLFPGAKGFADYRKMLQQLDKAIDAVIISTPDHTHAPAALMAMEMGKPVYCQKPLTHHVTEARAMRKMAEDKNLVTQMGIQIHSWKEYRGTAQLIQSGIIGKVHTVRAWSNKNWGYDGPAPTGSDPVPANLDWNLWLGTSPERPYKDKIYHPGNWRKLLDYGCGTLGDMGVHIFDTPYTALALDVPKEICCECRKPNGFAHPEHNIVTYEFPGTQYTTNDLKWVWYDGVNAPKEHKELKMPKGEKLPEQGAMFIGEKGRLLLPHIGYPKLIVDGKMEKFNFPELEEIDHYHQFVDACLGKTKTSAPFSYAARLTESILLGVVANRFPNEKLHWDNATQRFSEAGANLLLDAKYRQF
ncbi:MAG: Gfo/Idh/MocA family oxidoreductase [Saprospiraceae bacterium]|jgi:predicted dehydrogenase|nr:Gfo/Idh/MocA family oxidoreductase [Saprospiraceae bacterium]